MKTYGYIRVSTDKQDSENQKFEIENFARKNGFEVSGWVDETMSGTKDYHKRALYPLMKKVKAGDRIICSELSRLGRELMMIMEILRFCMERKIEVWTVKDNYRLGDDIQAKVLAFAFGISAEIERKLISQRTIEALKRKRAEGVILGRPRGRLNSRTKLTGKDKIIQGCLAAGFSITKISKRLNVHRITLANYIKRNNLQETAMK